MLVTDRLSLSPIRANISRKRTGWNVQEIRRGKIRYKPRNDNETNKNDRLLIRFFMSKIRSVTQIFATEILIPQK